MPRKSKPGTRADRNGASAGEQPAVTLDDDVDPWLRVGRLRLILFGLLFGAGAVVVIWLISLTDLPEWAITTVEHTMIGLIVAAIAAVLIPLVVGSTELSEKLIDFLKRAQSRSLYDGAASLDALQNVGISRVYVSRNAADADIAADLKKAQEIRIVGISLDDWTARSNATLGKSWTALRERIERPDRSQPCNVKIMLADPRSLGAVLRSEAEEEAGKTTSLETSVEATAKMLETLAEKHRDAGTTCELRLYRVAPQLFICQADSVSYVQPYYLRVKQGTRRLPLVRCVESDLVGDLQNHFTKIWELAAVPARDYLSNGVVGIENGAYSMASANIFSAVDKAGERMRCVIEGARECVWLHGISLESYFNPSLSPRLYNAVQSALRAGAEVRVLLLHPFSTQAYFRSYREHLLADEGSIEFADYLATNAHDESPLVQDTVRTIKKIFALNRSPSFKKAGTTIEIKLYASAPFSFMLVSDHAALIEQYHYGNYDESRLANETDGDRLLGKKMPVVEYRDTYEGPRTWSRARTPYELLRSHYKFVWEKLAAEADPADLTLVDGRARAIALEDPGPPAVGGGEAGAMVAG